MKSLRDNGWGNARAAAICGLMAWLWLGRTPLLSAAQAPAEASGTPHAVSLHYREQPEGPVLSAGLPFSAETTPFKQEPALAQRPVVRGVLKFGNSTDQFVSLLWDYTQRKLYLDLNRNHDLTDDGVQVSRDRLYGDTYYYQTFTNIPLSFKTATGEHRMLVDLHLNKYGNQTGATASVRSFWEGQLSLGGKDWEIGFVEAGGFWNKIGASEGGYLLLRPWEERQRTANVENGSLEGFHFCRNLFFGRQSYRVSCTFTQEAGAPAYRLELTEQPAELGELKLTGKFIQRLVLTTERGGETAAIVLDTPGPVERVPVGQYQAKVYLRQGKTDAHQSSSGPPNEGPRVVVRATQPEVLAIGGPLTNTVLVSQNGRDLALSYNLVGARGDTYQLGGPRERPGFVVYQAGKKLHSGQFDFG